MNRFKHYSDRARQITLYPLAAVTLLISLFLNSALPATNFDHYGRHWYKVLYKDKHVGYMWRQLSREYDDESGDTILVTEDFTKVDAKFLIFFSFEMESHKTARQKDDEVFYYVTNTVIKGDSIIRRATLKSNGIEGHLRRDDEEESAFINKDEYDYTSVDYPEKFLEKVGEEKAYKILEFGAFEVYEISFRLEAKENYTFEGEKIPGKLVRVKGDESEGATLVTQANPPVLLRYQGKDKRGEYTIELTTEAAAKAFLND